MSKKQLLYSLLLSTTLLSMSVVTKADEVTTPVDPSTPIAVTPTEPTQPGTNVESPVMPPKPAEETPTEPSLPVPTDPTKPANEAKQPQETPSTPQTDQPPTPPKKEHKEESSSQTDDKKVEIADNGDGTKTVETKDGQTVTVTTDKSKPTNNPSITADQAQKAGASQVGTTSKVTNQVVSNVTSDQPLTLASGETITSIKAGVATLADGSQKDLRSLGAKPNTDGTYSVKTKDGKEVTLPETGARQRLGITLLGMMMFVLGLYFGKRQKTKLN